MERICRGCDADLTGTHGRREWCSECCRKQTSYSGECEKCGAPTNGSNGPGTASKLCIDCTRKRNSGRNAQIIEMHEKGESHWYIAEQLGMAEGTVSSCIDAERRVRGASISFHRLGGTAREREERRQYVLALVGQGWTDAEIAREIGASSAGSVSTMLTEMRRKGYDVPDRRTPKKNTPRFEQVSA